MFCCHKVSESRIVGRIWDRTEKARFSNETVFERGINDYIQGDASNNPRRKIIYGPKLLIYNAGTS